VLFALQPEQLGTGHAVQCALPVVPVVCRVVVILCGDVPLIKPSTIRRLIREHFLKENEVTLLAVTVDDPFGYGRVICNPSGDVEAIIEESDATADEKRIDLINSGIYCVNRRFLEIALSGIESFNAQQEIYLTDIIAIARNAGRKIGLLTIDDPSEVIGINTIQDLQQAEAMMGAT
jgi:bifunctional N-acetylglucosamine-1-phosphate-uridyltransferase/glucosamine-1-phosphate-acetyltransferase GlmU-like protein